MSAGTPARAPHLFEEVPLTEEGFVEVCAHFHREGVDAGALERLAAHYGIDKDAVRRGVETPADAALPAVEGMTLAELRLVSGELALWKGHGRGAGPATGYRPRTLSTLNQNFATISVGNKRVVMELEDDGLIKEFWDFAEFKKLLVKDTAPVGKTRTGQNGTAVTFTSEEPLADVWLRSHAGKSYDRLVYDMPGSAAKAGPDDFNGWRGFRVQPAAGSWERNKAHVRDAVCGGDPALYAWVMNWCAALVQEPGRHGMVAIVLRGGQGIGKGHFADKMLGGLFHRQQYIHIVGSNQLTGNFNEHLSGKCYVFADEATWGGDPRAVERLKAYVTEDTVAIERKYLKLVEEPSALHIVIASNNERPVDIQPGDRRFTVIEVSEGQKQNAEYFDALHAELEAGGLAAMLHELLGAKVDWRATRRPHETAAKVEVSKRSLSLLQRWLLEKLKTGEALTPRERHGSGGAVTYECHPWTKPVAKRLMHDDYIEFMNKHEGRRVEGARSTETELGAYLSKVGVVAKSSRPLVHGEREYAWTLKPLSECRDAWLKEATWPVTYDWEAE